jgi:hypothetical protein
MTLDARTPMHEVVRGEHGLFLRLRTNKDKAGQLGRTAPAHRIYPPATSSFDHLSSGHKDYLFRWMSFLPPPGSDRVRTDYLSVVLSYAHQDGLTDSLEPFSLSAYALSETAQTDPNILLLIRAFCTIFRYFEFDFIQGPYSTSNDT